MRKPKKESKPRLAGQKSSLRSLGNNVIKIEERVRVAKEVTHIICPWKCGLVGERILRLKKEEEKRGIWKWLWRSMVCGKRVIPCFIKQTPPFCKIIGFCREICQLRWGNATHPSNRNPTYAQLQVHGWKAMKRPFSRHCTVRGVSFEGLLSSLGLDVNFGGILCLRKISKCLTGPVMMFLLLLSNLHMPRCHFPTMWVE